LRSLRRFSLAFLLVAIFSALVQAAVLSGSLKDQSGAAIPQGIIVISGGNLPKPLPLTTDADGKYTSPDLAPGSYTIAVTRDGFQTFSKTVEISAANVTVDITLAVAEVETETTVSGKGISPQYANSDPAYRSLRAMALGDSFAIEAFTMKRDVATFEFRHGTLTFFAPVNGRVTGAIFQGDGHFQLKPITPLERASIQRYIKQDQVDEDFEEVVFRFTDNTQRAFLQGVKNKTQASDTAGVLQRYDAKARHRREEPQSMVEYLLNGEYMDNIDADVLQAIYNPNHPTFFAAYIRGRKYHDLRFIDRFTGAIPQILSPEEVALINFDPEGMQDGIWYLDHQAVEYQRGTANSNEDKRVVAARKFQIDTLIGGNLHLASTANITLEPLIDGERVFKFSILPNLRVLRVLDSARKELYYIQESRAKEGSLYVILPEATHKGAPFAITVEYAGSKVISDSGNGSYFVHERSAWYPNPGFFTDRSTYDLTFRIPHRLKLISIGRLISENEENGTLVSHWLTDQSVAVAGFAYGAYKKVTLDDKPAKSGKGKGKEASAEPAKSSQANYLIEGYTLPELPGYLSPDQVSGLAPTSMMRYALEQTRAQLQICTFYFGENGFDRIYVAEQPDFGMGQSWPNLVYLAFAAFLDSTQRYMLMGHINKGLDTFVREITPHEVSHQWWGHAVGWATYHDVWLSEGFAEFSAALFIQHTQKDWQKEYGEYWNGLRKQILEKNNFGVAPNDAGPIWMGERLDTSHSEGAYRRLIYPKGAYIVNMLRSLMWSPKEQDQPFVDMMHDYVTSHKNAPASTESFKAVVERHMQPGMNLEGNGRIDWFFNEWVYGTDVPTYKFDYQITPGEGGKCKLHATLTQSSVPSTFMMNVPIFGDFDGRLIRLIDVPVKGGDTRTIDVELPKTPKRMLFNPYHEILER
jgi:Peptidase family M1 domain/Carboxypeptidase regulatory-like domain